MEFGDNGVPEAQEDGSQEEEVNGVEHIGPEGQGALNGFRAPQHQKDHAERQKGHTHPGGQARQGADHGGGGGVDHPQHQEEHGVKAEVVERPGPAQEAAHHRAVVIGPEDPDEFEGDGAEQGPCRRRGPQGQQPAQQAIAPEIPGDLRPGAVAAANEHGLEDQAGSQVPGPAFFHPQSLLVPLAHTYGDQAPGMRESPHRGQRTGHKVF